MRKAYLQFLSLDPRSRAQTRPPDRHLTGDAVTLDLALRRQFHDKCAFCERKAPVLPYRFRPTSEALPLASVEGALAYGWLADVWQNLYTICDDCRPSPTNHFPVKGARVPTPTPDVYAAFEATGLGLWPHPVNAAPWAGGSVEEPFLLDPCFDNNLSPHMQALTDGLWASNSPRGEETIRHFRLNRDGLVIQRRAALEREAGRRVDASDLLSRNAEADLASVLPEKMEFIGFLESLARKLAFEGAPRRAPRQQSSSNTASPPEPSVFSNPPTLVKVAIRGFKGIEDLTFTLPTPNTPEAPATALLILGENAAGKSTILEAIALTLASAAARAELIPNPASLLLDPVFMGGKQPRHTSGVVRLTFRQSDGKTRALTMRLDRDGLFRLRSAPADLPVFAYGAYRHYLDDYRDWTPERGIVSLFRSDNLLSNPEKWLLSLERPRFNEVIAALRFIFGAGTDSSAGSSFAGSSSGGFERIEVVNDRCMVVTLPDGTAGVEAMTPLASVSSGFRTILALTCDVMRWLMDFARDWSFSSLATARGIVLIDEVEAHLHPRWKVQIMQGLRKALPHVTFIATTHDPLCLRGMKNGEVMVLQRVPRTQDGDGLPVKVEQLTRLPDVTNLNIEQLLTSDFFSVFDPDDPERGKMLAALADRLGRVAPDSPDGQALRAELISTIAEDVTQALPVGRSEVAMLVQEAVAEYLLKRGRSAGADRERLRDDTRARIVRILTEGRDRSAKNAAG